MIEQAKLSTGHIILKLHSAGIFSVTYIFCNKCGRQNKCGKDSISTCALVVVESLKICTSGFKKRGIPLFVLNTKRVCSSMSFSLLLKTPTIVFCLFFNRFYIYILKNISYNKFVPPSVLLVDVWILRHKLSTKICDVFGRGCYVLDVEFI